MRKHMLLAFFLIAGTSLFAQKIKDGETVDLDGLQASIRVVNKETVSIGGASFDRYKVVGSVKNSSGNALAIRLKSYPDLSSIGADKLVEFNCINATGARLTSKKLEVRMAAHTVNVTYPSKDKDGKFMNAVLPAVPVGYYLDAGQTVENDAIFIVPAGEELNVNVRKIK